jgi:DNA-binding NtrC family response regulator
VANILVIDDEETIRKLLRAILAAEGHDVILACGADEANRIRREQPVDLVITDLFMPGTDGIEVIVALRREAPDLRVVAMSGGGSFGVHESLEMAEPLGAFATLRKPFVPETVIEVVRRALAA